MFARLARYDVPDDRIMEAVDAFRDASRELEGRDGLRGGYVLTDAETGTVLTLTLWENFAVMDTSEVHAARLRQDAIGQAGGSVASVQVFEVAVEMSESRAETA